MPSGVASARNYSCLCDFGHALPWYEDTGHSFPDISGAVVGGSIFVLFVDDDAAFADAAAHDLEGLGLRVVVALGSKAALDAFESNAFDVVITDAKLLGDEAYGLALARMIRHKNPHVPIILMTAYPELLEGQVALPGAVMCKPLEIAELCRSIRVRQVQ
jgi:CheY-like chemotaxis protein